MKRVIAFAIASAAVAGLHAQDEVPAFEALYLHGRERLAATTSIQAAFVETTSSSLLLEPVVSTGTVVAAESGRVAMLYDAPEPRTVVIGADRLVVHWPDRDQTETLNIVEVRARVRRYFVDVSAAELRGLFDIEVSRDREMPGTYLVTMTPRRRQIQDAIAGLRIWVDGDTSLMARMAIVFSNGDSRDFRFEDVETNVAVDESLFAVLPATQGSP